MRHYAASVGIPSFRNFPDFPFGIITCRTSTGRYSPDFSESRSRARNPSSPPSRALIWATVTPSMPAVFAPALAATRSKANTTYLRRAVLDALVTWYFARVWREEGLLVG